MKREIYISLSVLAVVLFGAAQMSSCVTDRGRESANGQAVTLTLSTGTRAAGAALHDDADLEVATIRVMGYDAASGRLAFNRLVSTFVTDAADPQDVKRSATINVATGTFDMVFIANEASDPALAAVLADNGRVASIGVLRRLGFSSAAFDAAKNIPMAAFYDEIRIVGDDSIVAPDPIGSVNGTWEIALDRLAVRVEVTLTLTPAQYAKWSAWKAATVEDKYTVTLAGVPQAAYLAPGGDNGADAAQTSLSYEARTGNGTYAAAPGNIETLMEVDGVTVAGYKVTFPRIILPEKVFADAVNPDKAMRLQITLNDGTINRTLSGRIGSLISGPEASRDYTLPRNTYLEVTASVDDSTPENDLVIQATIEDWTDAEIEGGVY